MPLRFRFLPPLLLAVLMSRANAQPPTAPSTINKNPANWNVGVPVLPPDPLPITPAELQALTVGPTVVTFSGTDVPVDDAVKALLDAAHLPTNRFAGQMGDKKISVDWQQTPFWTAAAQIEAISGMTWDGRFGNGLGLAGLGGVQAMGLDGALAARTPFVTLIANSLTRTSSRTVFFGKKTAPPQPDRAQMILTAYFDPKLQVQSHSLRALKFQKQGETGLVAAAPIRSDFNIFSVRADAPMAQASLLFPDPTPPRTTFSSISGTLHIEIVAATQTFAVPDVLATPNAELTIGAAQYRLQSVTADDGQLTVQVRIAGGEANRGFRGTSPFSTVRVRDAQHRELPPSSSTYGGNSGTFNFRLKNGDETLPGPYSLDWPIVTAVKSLDVPFELRDVTVP